MESDPHLLINQLAIDDPHRIVKVVASDGRSGEQRELAYTNCKVIGNGSFGVVFQAKLLSDSPKETEEIAIKKVLQDKRFKVPLPFHRIDSTFFFDFFLALSSPPFFTSCHTDLRGFCRTEPRTTNYEARVSSKCRRSQSLFLLQWGQGSLSHICSGHLFTATQKDEVYLNLVLEYVPETVYRASRHYSKLKQPMPALQIKLYMYQLLRSLAYIHSVGICHRDIKPQNLLLNPATGILKLCDFGSAKILVAGEPNVSYICSRYYRAPELIFGATNYTTNIGKCC